MKQFILAIILAIVLILWATIASALEFHPSPLNLSHGTWGSAHEKTHTVNSKLRQRFGGECYYLSRDSTYVRFAKTSGVTLGQVASKCEHKGGIFGLYMRQGARWWNDTPLYTFDEWVSYTNGSMSYMKSSPREANHSLTCMFEMGYYAYITIQCLPDTYVDKQNALEFWIWHAKYNMELSKEAEEKGLFSAKQKEWRDIMVSLLPVVDKSDWIRIEQPKDDWIRIEQPKNEPPKSEKKT